MEPRSLYSPAEDSAIWKIAIEVQTMKKLPELLKKKMASKRPPNSISNRFRRVLLPHLRNTKFHPENKLILCKVYKVAVDDEFLKELEKDADVQLNRQGFVKSYKLKRTCRKNNDMALSNEEFIKITVPIVPKYREFSAEEDLEIWKYVLERHETFNRGELFWNNLSEKLNRLSAVLYRRFVDILLPRLHLMKFPVEDSLKLYKCCQVVVDKEYLKELKKHAELTVDESGCITEYTVRGVRAEKRKNGEKTRGRPKKVRKNESEDAVVAHHDEQQLADEEAENATEADSGEVAENENDEDNLIVDNVIPGTGSVQSWWPNVPVSRKIAPKTEWDNDDDGEIPFVPEPVISQVVITPAPVRHPKIEVVEPEIYAENEVGYVAEEEVVGQETEDQSAENETEVVREEVVQQEQSASNEMWKEVMQRIEENIQETINKTKVAEMKKDLEAVFEEKLAKMKAELEVSFETKMMKVMSHGMKFIQNEMSSIRNDIQLGRSDDSNASIKKTYLQNLLRLVTGLRSSETAIIEQKIQEALQNLPENDEKPPPVDMVNKVLDFALELTK